MCFYYYLLLWWRMMWWTLKEFLDLTITIPSQCYRTTFRQSHTSCCIKSFLFALFLFDTAILPYIQYKMDGLMLIDVAVDHERLKRKRYNRRTKKEVPRSLARLNIESACSWHDRSSASPPVSTTRSHRQITCGCREHNLPVRQNTLDGPSMGWKKGQCKRYFLKKVKHKKWPRAKT